MNATRILPKLISSYFRGHMRKCGGSILGWKVFGVMSLALGLSFTGFGADWALTGDVGAHDPTIIKEADLWWCFTTGTGVPVKFSMDGRDWKAGVPLFSAELSWWRNFAPNMGTLDVWAPDLNTFAGRTWCYYCVSEFGKNNSAIGLRSCTSIAAGDWRDDGTVISSKSGVDSFNAIDPNLTIDADGKPWLAFGSYFDGIHVVQLDPSTMKPMGTVYLIAARANGIEGANIVYHGGYYYLFVSIDRCCQGVNSTYKIAYGRSASITGPFLDKTGAQMLQGAATVFDSGDTRWKGPGGQDVYDTGSGWVIARHAYDANNNGNPTLLISDLYWDSDGWPTYVAPALTALPQITAQPLSATAAIGTPLTLIVTAGGQDLHYQWSKNGAAIAGAVSPSLTLPQLQGSDAGQYSVTISNAVGSVTSAAAVVAVDVPKTGRIINLSVRTTAGTGAQTLIVGFGLSGAGNKSVMIRASGPTLSNFQLSGLLPDPTLDLYQGDTVIASNDNWKSTSSLSSVLAAGGDKLGAFTLADPEAVLWKSVASQQAYTAKVQDARGAQGLALVEIYDEDTAQPGTPEFDAEAALINVSARAQVGSGAGVLIAGFIINGNVPKRVMIRGIGPTLANFSVTGTLADPQLQLFNGAQALIGQNDNWGSAANQSDITAAGGGVLGQYALDPHDAVLIVTLAPGAYTAQVSGAQGGTGVALVEVDQL